LRTWLRI